MTSIHWRIRCLGHFDDELTEVSQIQVVIDDIESERIKRPEFELVYLTGERESMIHVGALIREDSDGLTVGWLVSKQLEDKKSNVSYCAKNIDHELPVYQDGLFCGAPESVLESAILSKMETIELLGSLVRGESVLNYELQSFALVFGRQ